MTWQDVLMNMFSFGAYSYLNGIQQEDQAMYNEQAARAAFDRSMYAWRQQNEYNLPKNQMQRLKDAGLNPYLLGGSLAGTGVASGAPHSGQASVSMMPQLDFINSFINMARQSQLYRIQDKDLENKTRSTDADIEVKQEQARNLAVDRLNKELERQRREFEKKHLWNPQLIKYQKEIDKLSAENYLLSLQGKRQVIENDIRTYWKDNVMKDIFEGERLSALYGGKKSQNWFNEFRPVELELLKTNRDYRKREYRNLYWYGTPTPASITAFNLPVGAISNAMGAQVDAIDSKAIFNAGKQLFENASDWFKGLLSKLPNFRKKYRDWYDSLPWILR